MRKRYVNKYIWRYYITLITSCNLQKENSNINQLLFIKINQTGGNKQMIGKLLTIDDQKISRIDI